MICDQLEVEYNLIKEEEVSMVLSNESNDLVNFMDPMDLNEQIEFFKYVHSIKKKYFRSLTTED